MCTFCGLYVRTVASVYLYGPVYTRTNQRIILVLTLVDSLPGKTFDFRQRNACCHPLSTYFLYVLGEFSEAAHIYTYKYVHPYLASTYIARRPPALGKGWPAI